MLIQCWSTVYDAGPTLDQHRANLLCLLGNMVSNKSRQIKVDKSVVLVYASIIEVAPIEPISDLHQRESCVSDLRYYKHNDIRLDLINLTPPPPDHRSVYISPPSKNMNPPRQCTVLLLLLDTCFQKWSVIIKKYQVSFMADTLSESIGLYFDIFCKLIKT